MNNEQKYPTDLTDEQFAYIKPYLPVSNGTGRPPLEIRQVLNALLYLLIGGIPWRMLPKDFPNYKSVFHYFRKWRKDGTWDSIYEALYISERKRQGRTPQASAGCLDAPSVKNVGGAQEARGYDAGKKITGRKRHLLVDTLGLPLALKVTAANVSD